MRNDSGTDWDTAQGEAAAGQAGTKLLASFVFVAIVVGYLSESLKCSDLQGEETPSNREMKIEMGKEN